MRRSARISAVQSLPNTSVSYSNGRTSNTKRKNPPRGASNTLQKREMPQISELPQKKRKKKNETSRAPDYVNNLKARVTGDQEVQTNQSPEFLAPFPPQPLPIRDSKILCTQIEIHQAQLQGKKAQRWIRYEYFYSTNDEIYFRHNEFNEMLVSLFDDYQGKRKRSEWKKIRRQMGLPKRLSTNFLKGEREKLHIWREKALNIRIGWTPTNPFSCILPPLPQQKMLVMGIHDQSNEITSAILQVCANGLFGVSFIKSTRDIEVSKRNDASIDAWLPEEAIMEMRKIIKTRKESPEKGLLTTLAIAAEVSPRHNGDVRTLKTVIGLLKEKKSIVEKIQLFHDDVEEVKKCNGEITEDFKAKYAQVLVRLDNVKRDLKPQLLRLRASQEKSPFRSLQKRL